MLSNTDKYEWWESCHRHNDVDGIHTFFFSTEDIYEEVYKRTSFRAKFMPTDSSSHSLDAASFTRDERFMFNPFIEEASARIYECVKPYMHNIENAYEVNVEQHNRHDYSWFKSKNDSLSASISSYSIGSGEITIVLDVVSKYKQILADSKVRANVSFEYNCVDQKSDLHPYRDEVVIDFDYGHSTVMFAIPLRLDPGHSFAGIDYKSLKVDVMSIESALCEVIKKGDSVKLSDGTYVAKMDFYAYNFGVDTLSPAPLDYYNGVRYNLTTHTWQNKNAMTPAYNAIRESIVTFIIYQWFLIVKPDEAVMWAEKFTDNCIRISDALQSIDGNKIKRKYRYF